MFIIDGTRRVVAGSGYVSRLTFPTSQPSCPLQRSKQMIARSLAAAFALAAVSFAGTANAQDVAAGEKSFNKCRACHQVGEIAKNSVGPELNGLFGRKSGSVHRLPQAVRCRREEEVSVPSGDWPFNTFNRHHRA